MKTTNELIIYNEIIESKILFIRGKKVIMDQELASLYGVKTKHLNQAVKRNISRFPEDFMFRLDNREMKVWSAKIGLNETKNMRSQSVTSYVGGRRHRPYVFTEQGIAMLSSVLNSERAIQVNIQIMRTFTKIREMLASNRELREKIEQLEKKYDGQFKVIFKLIKQLLETEVKPKNRIGFKLNET